MHKKSTLTNQWLKCFLHAVLFYVFLSFKIKQLLDGVDFFSDPLALCQFGIDQLLLVVQIAAQIRQFRTEGRQLGDQLVDQLVQPDLEGSLVLLRNLLIVVGNVGLKSFLVLLLGLRLADTCQITQTAQQLLTLIDNGRGIGDI